jgi:hypothetical protein
MNMLSRRTLLQGVGAAIALPWLEAMGPVFLYVPNGINMADWTPKAEGGGFELTPIMKPLEGVKEYLTVLTGLTADKARAHGDGGGDHARALGAFLTGCQPRKTDGTDIRAGVSVDQVAASRLADQTRLPSLEIGAEHGSMAGNCDSGYSCVYSSTMSWKSATQPLPKEVNPKLVFERLFGGPDKDRVKRDATRKSILDFVREDAGDLTRKLGGTDRRKLDEYFTAIRDIELRIERAAKMPPVKTPEGPRPTAVPAKYEDHLRLMADLMVLAFQADITRVVTFVLANEGSNKPYPFIGVSEGHHDLSHHGNDAKKKAKIAQINTFHVSQLAYLLTKLKATKEGAGNLLDHSMIAYGSGNSDGNAHNHDDLPVVLAGGGCGTIKPGRHLRFARETPLNNLWVSLLDRLNVKVERLGDSTGALTGLRG